MEPSENAKHAVADVRWQRIVHNDLENVVMGLVVVWASLLSAYSPSLHTAAVVAFAVSRVLHTVYYAYEMQPHRGIAWFVAVLAIFIIATNGAIGVMTF
jgi:glutathione S-transferase